MLKTLSFLCLFWTSLYGSIFWHQDVEQALQESSEKPLLVIFLGSEECPWTERFQSDVLDQEAFLDLLKEEVVFVKTSDRKGASVYQIEDFPTALLLYPNRDKIEIAYQPLEAEAYAAYIQEILNFHAALHLEERSEKELEELYVQAEALNLKNVQWKILAKGLEIEKSLFFLLESYKRLLQSKSFKDPEVLAVRKKILSADSANKKGAQLQIALFDFEARERKFKSRKNPLRVVKSLLSYVKEWGEKDKENLWKVEWKIAQFLLDKDNKSAARKHAKAAYAAAPKEMKPIIQKDCFSKKRY